MLPFINIDLRNNPHYHYSRVLADINYNFGLLSGISSGVAITGAYLNLSGGTVTGQTTFSGNSTNPVLVIRNPDTYPSAQDSFQVYDGSGTKQVYIDGANQFAFNAGLNGPLNFGTFANPSAGLGGFSAPNQVINVYSVNTIRMGVGGTGSYFATTEPNALFEVRGKADEVQFIAQANGSQTANIFEVRNSSEIPKVIIDSLYTLRGPSMSATTLSAGTYYSGITPLELIINSLITATTSTITGSQVQPGINTFTAGTNTAPTVNVTGLSVNNILVSGLTYLPQIYTDEIVPYNAGDITIGSAYYGVTLLGPITMDNVIVADGIFDNITVTGNSILNNVTATTITSTTVSAGEYRIRNTSILRANNGVGSWNIELGQGASGVDGGNGGYLALGTFAYAEDSSIAIGLLASTNTGSLDSIAIGRGATVDSGVIRGVAIGRDSNSKHNNAWAIGYNAVTTASNQMVFGAPGLSYQFMGDVNVASLIAGSINVTGTSVISSVTATTITAHTISLSAATINEGKLIFPGSISNTEFYKYTYNESYSSGQKSDFRIDGNTLYQDKVQVGMPTFWSFFRFPTYNTLGVKGGISIIPNASNGNNTITFHEVNGGSGGNGIVSELSVSTVNSAMTYSNVFLAPGISASTFSAVTINSNNLVLTNGGGYEIKFVGGGSANIYQSEISQQLFINTNGGNLNLGTNDGGSTIVLSTSNVVFSLSAQVPSLQVTGGDIKFTTAGQKVFFDSNNYLELNRNGTGNSVLGGSGSVALISNNYSFYTDANGVRNNISYNINDNTFQSYINAGYNDFIINHGGVFGNNRLGVNTSAPAYNLDVNGTTRTSALIVTGSTTMGSFTASGATITGDVNIYGNVYIAGTATTINTQTLQTADNNINLNLSGTHLSSYGGGITVLSGTAANGNSTFNIDANGDWSANTSVYASAITLSNLTSGRVPYVTTGGKLIDSSALTFNGTDLLSINASMGYFKGSSNVTVWAQGSYIALFAGAGNANVKIEPTNGMRIGASPSAANAAGNLLTIEGKSFFGSNTIAVATVDISAGSTTVPPIRINSGGTLTTTPIVGAIEFDSNKFYGTITAGTRYEFTNNSSGLTSTRIPFVDTKGRLADSSNLTYNGIELRTNALVVTGNTVMSGSVTVTSFADTGTTRMVETNSGGTLSATRQIVSAFGLPSSAMTALSLNANWDNNGLYTGTTIDSTYQGQEYYDSAYYYRAVSDNYFIRLIRG